MTTPEKSRDTARARVGDPFTSHAAAVVATRSLPTHRQLVLAILEDAGRGLTHEQIIAEAGKRRRDGTGPRFSEQSLRSRCHELERDGLVVVDPSTGSGRSRFGNPSDLHYARSVYSQLPNRTIELNADDDQGVLL